MDRTMNDKKDIEVIKNNPKVSAEDTGRRVEINVSAPKATLRKHRPKREQAPKKIEEPKIFLEKSHEKVLELEPKYVEALEIDESGDFAALLAESEEAPTAISFKVGDKVKGKVVHVGKEHSFIALGPKLEASIDTALFKDEEGRVNLRVGQMLEAYVISVHQGVTLSNVMSQSGLNEGMLLEAKVNHIPVEGKIAAVNKGGFDVMISGKRAFCPVGQIDLKFVSDPSVFVGRTENFLIERIEEGGRNIVVSRRALLAREAKASALNIIKDLEIGKRYDAVITRVADFGAFADIGGLEGLIPRSEISYGHVDRVIDAVSTNDKVEVVVLSFEINEEDVLKSRLSFSLKKAKEDPYQIYWPKIKEGATFEGRVVRLESFGAFVELFPGIDGLIHISELAENRVAHPKDVLSVGDPVSVRVLSISESDRRIGLSLREAVSREKHKENDSIKVERGQKVSGLVSRIERYGVFLTLDNGATALLPQSEIDLPQHSDLARAFSMGDRIDVVIIDVDAKNRIRVSKIAHKQMEERDSYLKFKTEEQKKSGSFGSFADLIKKHNR